MKVLLTGATGFVGGNVLAELRAKGHEAICLVRPESADPGATVVRGDIRDPETLKDLPAVDAVLHLVGIIQEHKENTFERVHVDGTRNLLDAAKRIGAKKFVHMSALGARADGKSRYHRTKGVAEEAVRSSGLAHTILRPSIIFGREASGRHNEFVRQMLDLHGKVMWIWTPVAGSGRSKMQPVWVGDVARFFVDALTRPQMENRSFDLGGPDAFPFQEIQDLLCRHQFGKVKWHIHFPLWYMKCLAFFMELALSRPPVTRDQLKMVPEDNTCDMGPALEACPGEFRNFEEWCKAELG